MDPDTSANHRNVDVAVTFNQASAAKRVSFSTNGPIEFKDIDVGTVTFELNVVVALQARFPSNPIQWVDNSDSHNPIDPPRVAEVRRLGDDRVIVEIGALPGTQTYSFFVIVQTSDGRFFGTDPTIVTMRPGPGEER